MRYLSEDGKIFTTAEECMEYEYGKKCEFYMFDLCGDKTNDYDCALFIYCPGLPDKLFNLVEKNGENSLSQFGCTKENFLPGLYFHNGEKYQYLDIKKVYGMKNLLLYLEQKRIV